MTDQTEVNLSKYERMKKLGLPLNSILNRMKMDGIADNVIAQWQGGGSSPVKTTEDKKEPEKTIMEIRPQAKMKPFHWAKITQYQVDNTVWQGADKMITKYKINWQEVETLFQQSGNTVDTENPNNNNVAPSDDTKNNADHEHMKTQLIDPKRVQNVMIGLSRIGLDEDEILEAILKMDDDKLPPEKVRKLLPYVPTDGELHMVREYVKSGGDISVLSEVEKFFVKMMDFVGLRSRLNLWLFKSEFPVIIENIKERIKLVRTTIEILCNNEHLQHVLNIILAIGNYLNAGTSRGNAFGFHVEPTLDMLEGMKGNDKKTSLLMYVIQTVKAVCPDALQWVDDLHMLPQACKIQTSSLQQDVDAIIRDMNEIETKIKSHRRTMTKTHTEWTRDGSAVSLNQVASHFRVVSRQPKALQIAEFSTYDTLRASLNNSNDKQADKVKDESDEDVENMFSKLMLQFYKRANATVREVDTEFKKAQSEGKELAKKFGYEEDRLFEDILGIFNQFRERFIKAEKEMLSQEEKNKRKEIRQQQTIQLVDKLKNRPNKDAINKYSVNESNTIDIDENSAHDDPNNNNNDNDASHNNQRTKDIYQQYLAKKKDPKTQPDQKQMWV